MRTVDDARALLLAGADKVSFNSAAVATPEVINAAAAGGRAAAGIVRSLLEEDVQRALAAS